ncbi:leucine-rich repeat domain-containing protein [Porphyromonas loveana]|uniref:Leucine rich repeat (LRR) protein n=1 Tax=Porphyromonas loveana TaxID=1884669 RepID=A0A2U1F753_9PORP|nr:hypothetical protein [Porphyromonas loveana]PVZ08027.1 hypothetical protein C7382_11611 [Porphyromonas loveana]
MRIIQSIVGWVLVAMVIYNCTSRDQTQVAPAPTDGTRIVCSTEIGIGNKLKLKLAGRSNSIWIDLNNNGSYDSGEKGITGDDYTSYTVASKDFTIYGDVTMLDCSNNRLTKLDLQHNTNLTDLVCSSTKLTSLDLSQQTDLQTLDCEHNKLVTLIFGNNKMLTSVKMHCNDVEFLDLSLLPKLTYLDCSLNHLTRLNVQKNADLEYLDCAFNDIKVLDVRNNAELMTLECEGERTVRT